MTNYLARKYIICSLQKNILTKDIRVPCEVILLSLRAAVIARFPWAIPHIASVKRSSFIPFPEAGALDSNICTWYIQIAVR